MVPADNKGPEQMTATEKQIIIALIRGLKFMASLLEKVKKGEAV